MENSELREVENQLKKQFVDYVINSMVTHTQERDEGIHISAASYECDRKLYLDIETDFDIKKEKENYIKDVYGLSKVWVGSKLHETAISEAHEQSFKIDGDVFGVPVTGTADEIFKDEKGRLWIVDKKFVSYAPNFTMQNHHRIQVGYYAWMYYQKYGVYVDGIILFYYLMPEVYRRPSDRSNFDGIAKVFAEELTHKDIDDYGAKLQQSIAVVKKAKETKVLPEMNKSWYCLYCKHNTVCFKDGKVELNDE